jgi:hypothetical protein
MLIRAISAPAHSDAPGILRYSAESLPPINSAVKFAPLPQTEVFGRRAKFSSRLGVQGRSGILSKQHQHPDGINYDPNAAAKETAQTTVQGDASAERNGYDATHGSTPHQASETSNLPSPQPDSSLDLRRFVSEAGTSTASTKRSSLKFWKKASKMPALPTIPYQGTVFVPGLPAPSPQIVKEPVSHVGASGEPPATHAKNATPPASTEQNCVLQFDHSDDANSSTTAVDVEASPTSPTHRSTPDSSAVSTPSTENPDPVLNMVGGTATEGVAGKTGVKPSDLLQYDGAATSELGEPLEISINILDGKVAPPISPSSPTPV